MAVFEYPSDHVFLVFLFHLLGMIYPSPKRKYGSCPGWFTRHFAILHACHLKLKVLGAPDDLTA